MTAARQSFVERVALLVFLLGALAGGLTLAFSVPPFGGLDEPFHWFRTLQVARGELLAPKLGANNWGGSIDAHDVDFAYWFANQFEKPAPIARRDAQALSQSLNAKPAENVVVAFPSTASFPPTAYLPAAIPLFAARHLHLAPAAQVIAGRLGQLCAYVLLVAVTLWVLPAGRLVAAGLLTMPTLLHLASCFSADPVNIGLASLLVACCLRLHADPAATLHGWRTPAVFGLVVLTGTLKITYLPLSFLLLLCPGRCFGSRRSRWIFIGSALLVYAAVTLWWARTYDFVPGAYWHQMGDPNALGEPGAALRFVVHHLLLTLDGVYRTVYWAGWYLWEDTDVRFGGHPAPFSFFVPGPWAALEAGGLLVLALLSGVADRKPRIVLACWGAAFGTTALVLAAFRLAYGRPEVSTLFGLQGRYFAVALLLGLLGIVYATPPIFRLARVPVSGFVFFTHAFVLVAAIGRYASLWQ